METPTEFLDLEAVEELVHLLSAFRSIPKSTAQSIRSSSQSIRSSAKARALTRRLQNSPLLAR
jgi:hypothetical protein